jgi:ATP-dependent DNA helicase RecQ
MSTTSILQHYWGFDSLRPLQQEVVQAAIEGRDALVVMPTGGGKSLCFQLPPLLASGLTLVISPLISLSGGGPAQRHRTRRDRGGSQDAGVG